MTRGYAAIGLFNSKIEANIGGAMRAAYCYGASLVIVSGNRYKKQNTDTPLAYKHIPLINCDNLITHIPMDCIPVAVELKEGARDLRRYTHPERAFYIFGPEDGSIEKEILERCRDVVYIPTRICMNLAATVNVVLYDRLLKGR